MAQSVEQLIRNQQVSGSSPLTSSIKKVQESCGFLDFFAFSELFFFLLEQQRKEGRKSSPPQCGEELHKRPFQPLCGPGRRVWLPTGGLDPQARTKPSKPKILDLFKACFHFRHILRGTGCYNENGESQYHSIPVRFTLCVTSGIHEPPESTIIPLRVDSMNVHSIWRCAGSVVWPFRDAERKKLEPSRNLLQW